MLTTSRLQWLDVRSAFTFLKSFISWGVLGLRMFSWGLPYSLGDLAGEWLGSAFLPQAPVQTWGAAGDQGWPGFTS